MAYVSRRGKRPDEYASKSSHGYIIKDETVREFLAKCEMPKRASEISISSSQLVSFEPVTSNPINHIIAIDGGYSDVPVNLEFPSSTVCFFQIGALIFSIDDLESINNQPFIDPNDMAKLKRIQRLKFPLPTRNITLKDEANIKSSIRRSLYDFFCKKSGEDLMGTLKWFVFQEYDKPISEWILSSCPVCKTTSVSLSRAQISKDYTFECPHCGGKIYLTDIFRLQEGVDDEIGAGGIVGYASTAIEQIIIVHLIRIIVNNKPDLLKQILFIKDGPLAFFGLTANMYKPMRELVRFLFKRYNLFLAGLEKSGAFVEHADEIGDTLDNGSILLLDNDYIYKYIIPGKADPDNPYGRTTYYSSKLIFKTNAGNIYVVTIPTLDLLTHPTEGDLRNLQIILTNIEKLKCDMYDNSLLPVALTNKLVSLADHPSSKILQKFAIDSLGRKS